MALPPKGTAEGTPTTSSYRGSVEEYVKFRKIGLDPLCFDFEEQVQFVASRIIRDHTGKKGVPAQAVYLVDPCQAGQAPLKTLTLIPTNTTGFNNASKTAGIMERASYHSQSGGKDSTQEDLGSIGQTQTSAIASTNVLILDIKNLAKSMAINITISGGVAPTWGIDVSIDNSTFTTLDTGLAIGPKQYVEATVGATLALSPLSFRFIRISVTAAAAANTSTILVAVK